jgi:hypothetical protein
MNFNLALGKCLIKPINDTEIITTVNKEFLDINSNVIDFSRLSLTQQLNLFRRGETEYRPTNNIFLLMELQNDGTGDYGWIKEYIKIFNKVGYTNEQIYVILALERKFFSFDEGFVKKIPSEEFAELLDFLNKITGMENPQKFKFLCDLREIKDDLEKLKNYMNNINISLESATFGDSGKKNLLFNIDGVINNPDPLNPSYENIIKQIKKILENYKFGNIKEICEKDLNNNNKSILGCELEKICEDESQKYKIGCVIFKLNIIVSVFDNYLKIFNLLKNDSYEEGVNYIISDLTILEEDNFLPVDSITNKCYIPTIENNAFDNSILVTFTSTNFPIKISKLCKNVKIINMSEGGMSFDIDRRHFLASGVGKDLMGLYNSFDNIESQMLQSRTEIINFLKGGNTTLLEDDVFNDDSKYHYAYIGQLETRYNNQFLKYVIENIILLRYIPDDSTHYLFSSKNIIKNTDLNCILAGLFRTAPTNSTFEKNIKYIINGYFGIKIIFKPDGYNYDLQLNNKILKVRYFNRLSKPLFLSMVKYAESPVFSTGDLSTQEALLLNKYVIFDYISNKQPFVNKFNESFNKYINTKIPSESEKIKFDIKTFYKLFENFDSYVSETDKQLELIKIFYVTKKRSSTINNILDNFVDALKKIIPLYSNYKRDVIDKVYNMNNNFNVLLTLVGLYQNENNFLIPNSSNNKILSDLLLEISRRGGGNISNDNNTYLQKYLKYKNKYIQLKNKLDRKK